MIDVEENGDGDLAPRPPAETFLPGLDAFPDGTECAFGENRKLHYQSAGPVIVFPFVPRGIGAIPW
jgi:hypothetical protein